MKKVYGIFLCVILLLLSITACSKGENTIEKQISNNTTVNKDTTVNNDTIMRKIIITIGDKKLNATLTNNSSATALFELVKKGPLSVNMTDYGNMEKVGILSQSLPTNDEHITTQAGDIILYQGNALVIYYAQNTWTFTRLGKIENVTQESLKSILGTGNVTVVLSLDK